MLITLSYPHEDDAAGDTIEVDDDTGLTMIKDGLARLPDADAVPPPAKNASTEAWAEHAQTVGLELEEGLGRDEIIELVEQHQQHPDRATPETPPAGADT